MAGLLFIVSAPCQNTPVQKSGTSSALLQQVTLVGRVLASPDPLTNYGGSLDCHFEEFLFGAESNGERGKKVITPVLIALCYYGNEEPLTDPFFDHSKLYELHVDRTGERGVRLKDVAYHTFVNSATGEESPPEMGMQVLDGAPKDLLKPDLLLPCYELRWGGFKILSQGTAPGHRTPNSALETSPGLGLSNADKQIPQPPCKSAAPLLTGDAGKPSWLTTEQLLERAIHCEAPTFLLLASQARIQGTVILSILVDQKGEVSCIQAITGHPMLLGVAIDAARKWKFKRMLQDGKSVGFYGWLAFRFSSTGPDSKHTSCLEAHW